MLDMATTAKTKRRARTKRQAVVLDFCTGCGGSPVCQVYCKYNALELVDDPENYPYKRMMVNTDRCIGCGACLSGGKDGMMLTGCPWNAIRLKPVYQQ
ncbi:MAG: 4Fe-4S dicluster domain-containing protein [Thermodesulfobacteriota bacterium]|nr:4Fe-4S dicluster domain-containing protein [Thermodesulfobacteriota bacterium]